MITRYACTLNGVSLDSLDPCIHITDLTELPPRQRIVTAPCVPGGLHVLQRVRESLTVRVRFLLRAYEPQARRTAMQKVFAWAEGGGVLTFSDRPGQQLQVVCDSLPGMSSLCWLDEMELSFTACRTPFWESAQRVTVTTADSGTLTIPGTAPATPVTCQVVNLGEDTLTTLTLTASDTSMTFSGLTIAPGSAFILGMRDGVLSAVCDGESLLMHRSADSDDLLTGDCGADCPVSVSADQRVMATFIARGRYL